MSTNDSVSIDIIDAFFNLFINILSIYIIDNLIQYFSTNKGRWYKIHFLANTFTFYHIYDKVIYLIIDPSNNYIMFDNNNNLSMSLMNYHLSLHIYHFIFFNNLNFWDYFHHIIFAFFGIIPGMLFINSNQLYFQLITAGGLTGMIEYGTLTLVKHDIMSKIMQKKINVFIYIFVRLPLCIMGSTYNMIAYINGYITDPLWITLYLNMSMYLNGTLFTYLTCKSYYEHINRSRLLY